MRTTILNLLSLNALNVIGTVYALLAFIYFVLVLTNLWSIWSTGATQTSSRFAWTLVVIVLPVVGMYCYGLWSLTRSDLSSLRQIGLLKNK